MGERLIYCVHLHLCILSFHLLPLHTLTPSYKLYKYWSFYLLPLYTSTPPYKLYKYWSSNSLNHHHNDNLWDNCHDYLAWSGRALLLKCSFFYDADITWVGLNLQLVDQSELYLVVGFNFLLFLKILWRILQCPSITYYIECSISLYYTLTDVTEVCADLQALINGLGNNFTATTIECQTLLLIRLMKIQIMVCLVFNWVSRVWVLMNVVLVRIWFFFFLKKIVFLRMRYCSKAAKNSCSL